ncbi:enoyl-CoA hydratase/carnithine racemase [Piptocephalis cylindrospora]|uniref:Enoyl-CoA hydratase/carnithine racemase n=1 Tax=Piptocephalis cylindrospora TaxID=1907219 RepID=A0A4V1IXU1_9FUNG|nr:enoyl-CoA hydratase/carnithine racemase [Piptocephalis cylindrospora]|eukprot:RKP12239.1 enoyl-CoA hydratase/carnithine racemase [Piptocephalis cylindrospora]
MSNYKEPKLPHTKYCILEIPIPRVLLITMNRPKQLNALHLEAHHELDRVWSFFEGEPELWCALLTGAGDKAFCAGADLKSMVDPATSASGQHAGNIHAYPDSGFGGLSRSRHAKPIIAVVHGVSFGGGVEIILAADLVVATSNATFSLPEVSRGVVAANGGLARLARSVGYQRAMELSLTGKRLTAQDAQAWGLVNALCPGGKEEAMNTALDYAKQIISASPDAVSITKTAIQEAFELGEEAATNRLIHSPDMNQLSEGANFKEGVRAFAERRSPRWTSRL